MKNYFIVVLANAQVPRQHARGNIIKLSLKIYYVFILKRFYYVSIKDSPLLLTDTLICAQGRGVWQNFSKNFIYTANI